MARRTIVRRSLNSDEVLNRAASKAPLFSSLCLLSSSAQRPYPRTDVRLALRGLPFALRSYCRGGSAVCWPTRAACCLSERDVLTSATSISHGSRAIPFPKRSSSVPIRIKSLLIEVSFRITDGHAPLGWNKYFGRSLQRCCRSIGLNYLPQSVSQSPLQTALNC